MVKMQNLVIWIQTASLLVYKQMIFIVEYVEKRFDT